MATAKEILALIVQANADQAIRELEKVGTTAQRELGKAETGTEKWSRRLTTTGAALVGVATVGAAGLYKLGSAASDLGETINKTDVIFGDSADEIKTWADGAATDFGQSKRAALDAASTFGQFGKAAGLTGDELVGFSTDLTELSSDMASFANTTPEEAVLALGAALRGENEPIRRFGILLDDATLRQRALKLGLIETTSQALTPQQKSLAAYNEILAQSNDISGDFDRTSDSLANQQRILKAEFENLQAGIGQGVLPVLTNLIKTGNDVLGVFTSLSPEAQKTVGTFLTFATAGAGAVGTMSLLAGQAIKMRERFLDAQGGLNNWGKAATVAGVAAVGLGAAIAGLQADSAEAEKKVDDLKSAVRELGISLGEAQANQLAEWVGEHDRAKDVMDELGLSVEDINRAIQGSKSDFENVRGTLQDYIDDQIRLGKQWSDNGVGAQELFEMLNKQRDAFRTAKEEIKGTNEATGELSKTQLDATTSVDALGTQTDETADATRDYYEEVKEANKHLEDMTQNALDLAGAHLDVEDALVDFNDKLGEYNKLAADGQTSAEDLAAAERDLARQAYDTADAVAEQAMLQAVAAGRTWDAEDAARAQIDALKTMRDTVGADSLLGKRLGETIFLLEAAARDRRGTVTLDIVITNEQALARIEAIKGGSRVFGARAAGGPVFGGRPYLVGEMGPELFVPGTSGTIVPNHALKSASGTPVGGAVYNIQVSSLNPQESARLVLDAIREYERRNGSNWRAA